MNIGDRVIVDASVTGDGVHHHGEITDIYDFTYPPVVDVRFDKPDGQGREGVTVTNLENIRKEGKRRVRRM